MLKILDAEKEVLISIVIGRAESNDLNKLNKALVDKSKQSEKVSLYLEIEDLYDINPEDFIEHAGFDSGIAFHKIAIVSDKANHKLSSLLTEKLTDTNIRFFQLDSQAEAHQWVSLH